MKPLTLSLVALLSLPLSAIAADASFYKDVAETNLAEVAAGQLAQQKSSNQKVKDFGAMMVKDHSAANEELKSIATTENITLASSPSVSQKAGEVQLEALSGASFDKAYLRNQVQGHKDTISLLEKTVSSGKDPKAQAFARKILPTVRRHLKAAEELERSAATAER